MKRILFLVCLIVAVAGCSQQKDIDLNTYDGKGLEFVHFASSSDSWLVGADDESFVYDVVVACTYKHDTDMTYNVKVGEGTTGVEGKDFKLSKKSVTIKAGDYVAEIPVEVLYETVGEGFVLELNLEVAPELINPTYGNTSIITVNTDKVTIDWDWLAGPWSGIDYGYYSEEYEGDYYPMEITKVSETECAIKNIWGTGSSLKGIVDFEQRTITIPGYQFAYDYSSEGYGELYFVWCDKETLEPDEDSTRPVVATMSPAGIVIDCYDFLMVGGDYDGYTYAGGICTTMKK
ncbi:MAG: membrane lipoprotein lipid attachment site-containing protein [Bacteroidaceae bacterium]|nr:membrane lipoprotein lipid attachment site-containing protein [Bacteroidaceae bacterium]